MLLGAALLLAGCESDGSFDFDFRHLGGSGLDTSSAVRQALANRPEPDARGVISYPTYQVVLARRGDTVAALADRVGVPATDLASYNALNPATVLNGGELLALPSRVGDSAAGGADPATISITSLASGAIDRAAASPAAAPAAARTATSAATTPEPIRHRVARGETAYSIARYYDVNVRELADWNGLPADLGVREGQFLLVPAASAAPRSAVAAPAATPAPGTGSPTPVPPSAARPLPATTPPAAATAVAVPPAPDLGASRSASTARMQMPVTGAIIRAYVPKKNDGVDIAAAPGTAVRAAEAGAIAAITKDTEGAAILVINHGNNLLTVYANIDAISVAKGDRVTRGQSIAKVRAGDPGFVHFEVRDGFESVDPMGYLQ
jgi:murein DD-endopeptidase MepM/ murein hydrolase activator NlpD